MAQTLNPSRLDEILAALTIGSLWLLNPLLRPWYSRWGSTPEEIARPLPGDELASPSTLTSTHAMTIQAPPSKIWPWLVQLGHGKGGLYSYTRLENLIGCDIHNADCILPEHQNLSVGDVVRMGPKGYPLFKVAAIQPQCALVLQPCDPKSEQPAPASWVFFLQPVDASTTRPGATRLIIRSRNAYQPTFGNHLMWRVITEPLQFVMERRMLLGIKRRAERINVV